MDDKARKVLDSLQAQCARREYCVSDIRRKALLKHFGSIKAIRNATYEELMEVDGMNGKAAESIIEFFADSEK